MPTPTPPPPEASPRPTCALPWTVDTPEPYCVDIRSATGDLVGDLSLRMDDAFSMSDACNLQPLRDAAYLVTAANAYPLLFAALRHIAYEPLTDDAEASPRKCLDEATRIAREALDKAGA